MSSFTADAAAAQPGPGWLRALRAEAHERFASGPLPTDAEEVWRYSRIDQLDLDAFRPLVDAAADRPRPQRLQAALEAIGGHAGLAVVRDGVVTEIAIDDDVAARGVAFVDLTTVDVADEAWGAVADTNTDSFTELNTAFSRGAVLLQVPDGAVVDRPIVVLHCLDTDGVAAFPRTIVRLGRNSEATVVEWQASDDVVAFVDPVVELDVAEAARLSYVNVQEWGERVWQTGYQASRVARDATLRSSVVALGGDYARVRTDSKLAGRGATSHLQAVYFGGGSQMHDFRTMQDHAAPTTTSDLLFKGAVQDRAQSVYSGLIRVRKEGGGTNAHQTNRNLVLSEGARAESVPNLEIEVNDVRCSHASAVGPIDDDQRYYLESRGIPPEVAERLIVLGFFSEVLEALPTQALTDTLRSAVGAKLRKGS
jgi:Fe-S cluster assembly protein SufD